jgi:hypothetical protein
MKLLFAPFRMIAARLAGRTARKTSDRLWALVDKHEPPGPEDREASWPKLATRLVIDGAVFSLVSGAADHAARLWFARLTGRWPGAKSKSEDVAEDPDEEPQGAKRK